MDANSLGRFLGSQRGFWGYRDFPGVEGFFSWKHKTSAVETYFSGDVTAKIS